MGNLCTRWFVHYDNKIVMLGLDGSGKTKILSKLKVGVDFATQPTYGFNCESIEHRKLNLTVWDLGGLLEVRRLWHYHYQHLIAVAFVLDSNDRARIGEARDELHKLMNTQELLDVPILIYANKQDLPNALSEKELVDNLHMSVYSSRNWRLQLCSADTGEGLYEGLDWIIKATGIIKQLK